MVVGFVSLVIMCAFAVPAHSQVTISRGFSEQEIRNVEKSTGFQDNSEEHWGFMFKKQGEVMMEPTRESAIGIMQSNYKRHNNHKGCVKIGAIVSLSENGGGVLEVLRNLQQEKYENIFVGVVLSIGEHASEKELACFKQCVRILVELNLTSRQVVVLRSTETERLETLLKTSENNKQPPLAYQMVSLEGLTNHLRGKDLLLDGLCGSEYEATTIVGNTASETLKQALGVLPKLSTHDATFDTVIVISHATPSGRNENGQWVNCSEFKCHYVLITEFPLTAIATDEVYPRNIFCDVQNSNNRLGIKSFLDTMKGFFPGHADDVEKIQDFFRNNSVPWTPINVVQQSKRELI